MVANSLRIVRSVCRRYSRPAELAGYLRSVAAQLARRCRTHLLAHGKLWEQPRPELVASLGDVCALHAAFVAQLAPLLTASGGVGGPERAASAPQAPAAAAKAAEAAELADRAFAAFGQFARRCAKLADMFGTVHQFGQLSQHTHIEGVAGVLQQFGEVRPVLMLLVVWGLDVCGALIAAAVWRGEGGLSKMGMWGSG